MAISVTHTKVTAIADDPAYDVGADEWNDEHVVTGVAESATQIIAGSGLTGGGTLAADRTLNVGAGTGISVAADAVSVDQTATLSWTTAQTFAAGLIINETSDPANPAANKLHLFCRDNGSGKTQLCVMFPTGGVSIIATED